MGHWFLQAKPLETDIVDVSGYVTNDGAQFRKLSSTKDLRMSGNAHLILFTRGGFRRINQAQSQPTSQHTHSPSAAVAIVPIAAFCVTIEAS